MVIKYTPPPVIEVKDDGYVVSSDVDIINAGTGISATDDGYGQVTLDVVSEEGSIIVVTFASTANNVNNKFLNTENIAASDGLPGVIPLTAPILKVTYSGTQTGGVSGDIEFRINTTVGPAALTVTLSIAPGFQTQTFNTNLVVAENDLINCKIASGSSGVAKPLVKCYV